MKKTFTIFIFSLCAAQCYAQLLLGKDTVRTISIINFGVGGYFGMNHFIPVASSGIVEYQNMSGNNQGLCIRLGVNLSKKVSLTMDLRYLSKNGIINYQSDIAPHLYVIRHRGFSIPALVNYSLKKQAKELFEIFGGTALNYSMIFTTYDESTDSRLISTALITRKTDKTSVNNLSSIIGISKSINISNKTKLKVFSEFEYQYQPFDIELITNGFFAFTGQERFRVFGLKAGMFLIF
jgi:hypothetical protein